MIKINHDKCFAVLYSCRVSCFARVVSCCFVLRRIVLALSLAILGLSCVLSCCTYTCCLLFCPVVSCYVLLLLMKLSRLDHCKELLILFLVPLHESFDYCLSPGDKYNRKQKIAVRATKNIRLT